MSLNSKWVPMKWPCGPLEVARLKKSPGRGSALKTTLEAWAKPSSLELLKRTPVNCLVVEWAAGEREDSAQQSALKGLLQAGTRLGLSFVGKISGNTDTAKSIATARASGLSAVIVENPQHLAPGLPIIVQASRDKVDWTAVTGIFSLTGNVWPGVQLKNTSGDTAFAGPTGVPWVNSNDWVPLLAGQLAPGKVPWLEFDPPETSTLAHPADYSLAIADSWAYGSRWIISLDGEMRAALLKSGSRALGVWRTACETLSFFTSHGQWSAYQPMGVLAVVSNFRGENAFMGDEVLNLLSRRQVQFRVMNRSSALAGPIDDLKGILWIDKESPSPKQLANLLAFVKQGGLLMAPAYWGPSGPVPFKKDWLLSYKLYNLGKGRIVVPDAGFEDPFQVARDAHLLVSRRNDLVRLYNPASTNCYSTLQPGGKRQLVKVINYAPKPADFVSLWVHARPRSGEFMAPLGKDSTLKPVPAREGAQFNLPTISVTCAVEFERS